jgi:acyl-CoA thioesterase FadM
MEEAEHALWREAGLSIHVPGSEYGFPRVSTSFDFHRALRFEQEFDIHIRVTAITKKSIQYTCELTDGDTRIATGALTIVCVRHRPNEPMVSAEIPADIRSRFQVAPGAPA